MPRAVGHAASALCLALISVGCGAGPPEPTKTTGGAARAVSLPKPSSTGVPPGWVPKQTLTQNLVVRTRGAVVEDVLLDNADLVVDAPDVTIRRVKLRGGRIHNVPASTCRNGMTVEDSTIEPAPGASNSPDSEGVIGYGGYTARRVKIWRRGEGFRVGGRSDGCGPVRIESSFVKISVPPGCPGDPHSDGIQGVDGSPLTIRNVTVDFTEAACGTAPFFMPEGQGNTRVDIDGMLVMGGGATFRLGVPGRVRGLKIVDDSWSYYPVDVKCSLLGSWSADLVTITRDYQVERRVKHQPCR
jgi:hypothetical protein